MTLRLTDEKVGVDSPAGIYLPGWSEPPSISSFSLLAATSSAMPTPTGTRHRSLDPRRLDLPDHRYPNIHRCRPPLDRAGMAVPDVPFAAANQMGGWTGMAVLAAVATALAFALLTRWLSEELSLPHRADPCCRNVCAGHASSHGLTTCSRGRRQSRGSRVSFAPSTESTRPPTGYCR